MSELQPLSPPDAKEMYHDRRRSEVREQTLQAHQYRLSHFVRWCENVADIDNMNVLNGRSLDRYQNWRRDDGNLNNVTIQTQLSTLRGFIRYCERIEAVRDGLHEKIELPKLSADEESREEILEQERANVILEQLQNTAPYSRDHALFKVMWETGARISGIHSLDMEDLDVASQTLDFRHRPAKGTTLKNGKGGERPVHVSPDLCKVVEGYLRGNRISGEDDHDRNPLFTSRYGRLGKTSIRRTVYKLTQACFDVDECPHDREFESCETRSSPDNNVCPSSVSPHDVRRGAITRELLDGVPKWAVSERMDVSEKVLDLHYDRRSDRERLDNRRQYFDEDEETA